MDEAKRMEEGINSPHNEYGHTAKLETNGGGDSIEHERDIRTTLEGESVQQVPKEQEVKHKKSRVETIDAFRGLTIVVSTHFSKIILLSFLCISKLYINFDTSLSL